MTEKLHQLPLPELHSLRGELGILQWGESKLQLTLKKLCRKQTYPWLTLLSESEEREEILAKMDSTLEFAIRRHKAVEAAKRDPYPDIYDFD